MQKYSRINLLLSSFLLLFSVGCATSSTTPSTPPSNSSVTIVDSKESSDTASKTKPSTELKVEQKEETNTNTPSKTVSDSSASKDDNLASPTLIDAKILKVTDGDTMSILINGKKESIRLLLVDTPESVHPNPAVGVQPFGKEASAFAKETLEGKDVKIEFDVTNRDKYQRLLGYLYVDGKMFNKLLLERGLARVAYVYEPNVKHVDEFREIQKEAQKKGLGIWSIENYAQEDGFHKEVVSNTKEEPKPTPPEKQPVNGCKIKGNITKTDKIYHVEGGRYYEQTKAEEYFCSEEEAIKAGYRKSKQ